MSPSRWFNSLMVSLFLLIYFASGFAALLYQVIWQRMLAIFSGADVFAATTIVASFMAGLGFGSLAGGVLADRISRRSQIALFAAAEGLTGVLGLLSKWWCYDVLYVRVGFLAASPLLMAAILFASLLVPTFLMGMTLPLLSKALTPTAGTAARRIGSIYGLNTLGAAGGAFITGWFLMGRFSFPEILRIGAGINFAVAVLAFIAGTADDRRRRASAVPQDVDPVPSSPGLTFPMWALVYALSGFIALSLEILWFRLLGIMLKSNSLTFPHLLGIYLSSLAVGILLGSQLVRLGKRPAYVFMALQSGITIYAGLSVSTLVYGLHHWPSLAWLRGYFGRYEPFDPAVVRQAIERLIAGTDSLASWIQGPHPNFFSLYVLLPLVLIAPPTLMMGMSFAFLQKALQNHPGWIGRRVGWLQAANIFGSTLGAVFVGGILLGALGSTGTLRLLIASGGIFLLLWSVLFARSDPKKNRSVYPIAAAIMVVLVVWSAPSKSALWGALHGSPPENVIHAEDGSGLSVLKNERADFQATTLVYTNGLGQSWIPYIHTNHIHSLLGILPIMLHKSPVDIAVIGLGSGDTLYSLGGREETQQILCMEIVRAELDTLRLLQRRNPYPVLDQLFTDRRIQYVFRDGRTHIGSTSKKYDIIEADALRPSSAFAGNLYSYEYFQLLKSRLKPGGFAVSWGPTPRVVQAFVNVFPHVLNFDSVLVGSSEPLDFDSAQIRERLDHPFTKAYYERMSLDVKQLVMPFFERPMERLKVNPAEFNLADLNSDLFPKDEYAR